MPGPVSDSYDPEFGTGENASNVCHAIDDVRLIIDQELGEELKYIVDVVNGGPGNEFTINLTEQEMRVIRFCLDRAKESI